MVWKTAWEITTSAECQCTWDSGIVPVAHPLSATLYCGGEERMVAALSATFAWSISDSLVDFGTVYVCM